MHMAGIDGRDGEGFRGKDVVDLFTLRFEMLG